MKHGVSGESPSPSFLGGGGDTVFYVIDAFLPGKTTEFSGSKRQTNLTWLQPGKSSLSPPLYPHSSQRTLGVPVESTGCKTPTDLVLPSGRSVKLSHRTG